MKEEILFRHMYLELVLIPTCIDNTYPTFVIGTLVASTVHVFLQDAAISETPSKRKSN